MRLLTDEQQAQIRSAMKMARGGLTSCRDNGDYIPPANPYFFSELDAALATLTAAPSLEMVGQLSRWPYHSPTFSPNGYGNAETLYAIKKETT